MPKVSQEKTTKLSADSNPSVKFLELATESLRTAEDFATGLSEVCFACYDAITDGTLDPDDLMQRVCDVAVERFALNRADIAKQYRQAHEAVRAGRQQNAPKKPAKKAAAIQFVTQPAERGQVVLTAKRGDAVLQVDTFSLQNAGKRAAYLDALNLSDAEAKKAHQTLLDLASRPVVMPPSVKQREEKETSFASLTDGRLIEQIAGGQFVLYTPSPAANIPETQIINDIEEDGVLYHPVTDPFIVEQNELKFPDGVEEYGTVQELDASIAAYVDRFVELKHDRDRLIVAALIRLSWMQDRLNEVPYLHATGEKGSGKSRLLKVLSWLCYRTLVTVQISESALFRICDKYRPTLLIDEFNPRVDSDDTKSLMQILNGGYDRDLAKVYRTEKTTDGNFTQKMYRCFGMKIFSGLEKTESAAFESRTIPIRLSTTTRTDIVFSNTGVMEREAAPIRRQLQLWRLRNYASDWMAELIQAEEFLRRKPILPRFSQIAAPLTMLLADDTTRADFRAALTQRTHEDTEERQDSLDGQIVKAIHEKLFGETEPGATEAETIAPEIFLEEGKPCEFLVVSELREVVNQDKPEKYHISAGKIGKRLSALGLQTKKILNRQSKQRDKKAVVFVETSLSEVFQLYNFPDFAKQSVTKCHQSDKYQENQLDASGDTSQKESTFSTKCHQTQTSENSKVAALVTLGDTSKPEIQKNASKGEVSPPVPTAKMTKKARAQL